MVIAFQFQNPPLMFDVAKNCAIIALNFRINQEKERSFAHKSYDNYLNYLLEVKKEIELL